MKTQPKHGLRRLKLILFAVFTALSYLLARAQIQQAWVARYNNGITDGTNQAVKMALDSAGNIYVTGFSQNVNTNLGYVTIKYAPNGTQLWATRYDSSSSPAATPAAVVLDTSNDVILTGSALTIKYDSNGNLLWTAPYAGTALAVDSDADVYVVGFSTNFGTVKIAPQGTNVWLTTYAESYGPTVSQSVFVDTSSNVYVSGLDSYYSFINNGLKYGPFVQLTTIKYGPSGNQVWKASQAPEPEYSNVQIEGAALDGANNLYLVSEWGAGTTSPDYGYLTYKYDSDGNLMWSSDPANQSFYDSADSLLINKSNDIVLTGVIYHGGYYAPPNISYGTVELDTNGVTVWTSLYPQVSSGTSVGLSLADDLANNVYVTGYSPGTNSSNDMVTIKYGPNGNQIWLQRYSSPGGGNAAGNAIAVDNNGNVYVSGYDTTAAGGTEMVLIKYSPLVLKIQTNGTALLKAQGFPGENFNIEASADLQTWLDLGLSTADTNGLMEFCDTNAPNYPARFYYTTPQ